MRALLHFASRLYPARWRKRYGVEFRLLLEEMTPRWRDVVNVLIGGLQMQVKLAHPASMAAVFSIVGALVAGTVAFRTTDRFASRGTMTVRRAGAAAARLDEVMPRMASDAFRRDILAGIVEKHDLYGSERRRLSTEEITARMRGDIGIEIVSPSVIQVSFSSADPRQARAVAGELMGQLVQSNFQSKGGGSGSMVEVIDLPDEPTASVNPRRVASAGIGGFGGGALLGTLIGLFRRRGSRSAS